MGTEYLLLSPAGHVCNYSYESPQTTETILNKNCDDCFSATDFYVYKKALEEFKEMGTCHALIAEVRCTDVRAKFQEVWAREIKDMNYGVKNLNFVPLSSYDSF